MSNPLSSTGITQDQLAQFAPKIPLSTTPHLLEALNSTLTRLDIMGPRRIQYFMSQAYFETQGFTKWVENLVYTTPERLVAVWPSRFTMSATDTSKAYAPNYVKNEQKLASLVYGNRYGNRDEASQDGYTFRGRGAFHLTFHDNYKAASFAIYNDGRFISNPELVEAPTDAISTAGWFWDTHKFNDLADSDSFTKMTTVINGSAVTVPERLKVLNLSKTIFI